MPAAWTNTTNAFTVWQRALTWVGYDSYDILGSGNANWTADHNAAEIIANCERRIIEDNPLLSISTATIAVASGARTATLPSTINALSVLEVRYSNSGDYRDGQVIAYGGPEHERVLPGYQRNDLRVDVPLFWQFSDDGSSIEFYELLNAGSNFLVTYQPEPQSYNNSDLANDSTNYSSVPDQHIRLLVYNVAVEFALIAGEVNKANELSQMIPREQQRLHNALTSVPGGYREQYWGSLGRPQPSGFGRTNPIGIAGPHNRKY